MIAAHSAFFSMSVSDAFCTFRILPRIGSSAWNSESLASLAVPSAESPSTMNSSLRSSDDRQSTSLAGSAEVARADLRRWFSRCSRAAIRVLAAAATLSSSALACCLLPRTRPSKNDFSSADTTCATIREAAGVPSTSLVCPSNCGSGSRTADHRGQPLEDVFLDHRLVAVAQQPGRPELLVQRPDQRPLESGHVRAALGRGDHVDERAGHAVVPGVPAQRDVDPELALHLGRGEVALIVQHRHGLGELAPDPASLSTSVTGSPVHRCAQNSLIPPSNLNSAVLGCHRRRPRLLPRRSSVTTIDSPGTR